MVVSHSVPYTDFVCYVHMYRSEQKKLLLLCGTLSVVVQRPAVKVAVTELFCCR